MREENADGSSREGLALGGSLLPFSLETDEAMRGYVKLCVNAAKSGALVPFTTLERASGRIVGSTSFLAIERQDRRLEIGATWITPSHQRSAVNTEAKLLQLAHCFEVLGCNRVEFKTDARNEKSRGRSRASAPNKKALFRAHMVMPGRVPAQLVLLQRGSRASGPP